MTKKNVVGHSGASTIADYVNAEKAHWKLRCPKYFVDNRFT